jgi:ribosomal peptide maturation radical SAM protein 1
MSVKRKSLSKDLPTSARTTGAGALAEVALVCMPFAPLNQPLLGISLLKAILAHAGIACDIHYLSLPFAERIGLPLYRWIWCTSLGRLQLGEWLFARSLFGREWDEEHPLLEELRGGSREGTDVGDRLTMLRGARDGVEAYLDDCLRAAPWQQYRIVGFSSTFEQNVASLALANRIKASWPQTIIVFGGANCEGEMGLELHRQFPTVDWVCRGESDRLFPALVESVLAGMPPPPLAGLIHRGDNGRSVAIGSGAQPIDNLGSLPYPDFDDYLRQLGGTSIGLEERAALVFESSRGCWHGEKQRCAFCGLVGQTVAFRRKSPGRLLDELTYLTRRHGISRLGATDNILDLRYLRDLVPAIIQKDVDWQIFYQTKASLRKEQLRLLKRAGMGRLQPGIESLSTATLKLMRKGCTALQNVQLLKWASELGIELHWLFLVGLPREEPEAYGRVAEMVPALLHLQPPRATRRIRLDRFSPYFDDPEGWGLTHVRPASVYRVVYPFPEASLRRLAYYFEFDYADGRDPSTYTAPLVETIRYWRDNYCPGALTSVSDDQVLVVHDRRPGAAQARRELVGLEKAAYEYCDEAHSLHAIYRHLLRLGHAVDREALRLRLGGWVADRLMVCDGDWFLSLAVAADDLAGQLSDVDLIRQALAGAMAALGHATRQARQNRRVAGGQSRATAGRRGGDVSG